MSELEGYIDIRELTTIPLFIKEYNHWKYILKDKQVEMFCYSKGILSRC